MARHKERAQALKLRKQGSSYSHIKEKLGISKSTLHYWLKDYPLSAERIRALRDHNAQRIERCRETKARNKKQRLDPMFGKMQTRIGSFSSRELFLCGLFLYWAEGTKTTPYRVSLSNTDPAMLRFFLAWLKLLGVDSENVSARLHLYSDMNIRKQIELWSKFLSIPKESFRKSYVKLAKFDKEQNYKGRFGYGTCELIVYGRDLDELVSAGIKVLQAGYRC